MIITKRHQKYVSYVGYTNNILKRLILHNNSKGAKFTKGSKWNLILLKKYNNKRDALKNEYKLKKNYKLRKELKNNFIKNENSNFITL